MTNYEKLLDEAYNNVKRVENSGKRFETPKVEGRFEGKKTVITNFFQISSHIRRDPEHFQKFLLKELATSGKKEGDKFILNNKISSKKINPKIEKYVNEFVICKECHKPDTEIIKEGKNSMLHCLACGAKHIIREKI